MALARTDAYVAATKRRWRPMPLRHCAAQGLPPDAPAPAVKLNAADTSFSCCSTGGH